MGRIAKPWLRKGRGWWAVVHGHQRYLGPNLKAAKEKLKVLLASSTPTTHGNYSVSQLVGLFLADCERRISKGEMSAATLLTHRTYLLRWAEACRHVKPEHLRVLHLDAWIDSHDDDWNQTTKSTAISRVKRWAAWCKRKGIVDYNHLRDAESPQQLRREAANPADLLRLEAAITCPFFRDWFQVLYDTGCRPGELRKITANDTDLVGCTAQVIGKRGQRVVGLTQRCRDILKRLSLIHPNGPLLRTPNGAEWSQSTIFDHFEKWRTKAGCPTVTPYHCRHALYTRWHDTGVDDMTIARQLGHQSAGRPHLGLIASTYGHLEGRHLADAAQLASGGSKSRKRG